MTTDLDMHVRQIDPRQLVGDKIQPGHPLFGIVWVNDERVSGAPCFFGTRVPVKTLFDCLSMGEGLEEFLKDFEGVRREQAVAVLEFAEAGLLAGLSSELSGQ